MSCLAGVDVGGSGIRCRLDWDGRTFQGRITTPMPRPGSPSFAEQLAGKITDSLATALDPLPPLSVLSVGLAGLPGPVDDPATLAATLGRRLSTDRVIVAGDSLTTHVGALTLRPGTIVAAGTGVIGLGTDHETVWQRADGWGAMLGDVGSGAWIGRRGLRAALFAHDHRAGGSVALLELMEPRFGGPDALVDLVYSSRAPAHLFASFAPVVATAAREGDRIAGTLWHRAGRALAETAVAASRPLPDDAPISWGGGLFQAGELLLEPFLAELDRLLPDTPRVPAAADSASGALQLAHEDTKRPLVSHPPYLYAFTLSESCTTPSQPSPSGRVPR